MKIGSNDVTALYLGTTSIDKAYLGSTEVWSSSQPTLPIQTLDGAWSGVFQYVPTSDTGVQVSNPLTGSDRYSAAKLRFWNGSEAGNYGATEDATRNRWNFASSADCEAWWETTPGYKVRVSFDSGTSWTWVTPTKAEGPIVVVTPSTSGVTTDCDLSAEISAASGGTQTDFYAGLTMRVEVYLA